MRVNELLWREPTPWIAAITITFCFCLAVLLVWLLLTKSAPQAEPHTCTKIYTAADGSKLSITWDDPRVCDRSSTD